MAPSTQLPDRLRSGLIQLQPSLCLSVESLINPNHHLQLASEAACSLKESGTPQCPAALQKMSTIKMDIIVTEHSSSKEDYVIRENHKCLVCKRNQPSEGLLLLLGTGPPGQALAPCCALPSPPPSARHWPPVVTTLYRCYSFWPNHRSVIRQTLTNPRQRGSKISFFKCVGLYLANNNQTTKQDGFKGGRGGGTVRRLVNLHFGQ